MAKYKEIQEQIKEKRKELNDLQKLLYKHCPHNNIEEKHYCDDDYAQSWAQKWSTIYKCKFCGLYGASDSEDKQCLANYEKLQKIFRRKIEKSFKKGK